MKNLKDRTIREIYEGPDNEGGRVAPREVFSVFALSCITLLMLYFGVVVWSNKVEDGLPFFNIWGLIPLAGLVGLIWWLWYINRAGKKEDK